MAFKGSNGVAVERRADLASLFCMIGRHGPAVALAVFAVVSVLAGFVIYRTVRGRRRRKKKTTAGSETDRKSSLAESDEAVTQSELEPQACATSTGTRTTHVMVTICITVGVIFPRVVGRCGLEVKSLFSS